MTSVWYVVKFADGYEESGRGRLKAADLKRLIREHGAVVYQGTERW